MRRAPARCLWGGEPWGAAPRHGAGQWSPQGPPPRGLPLVAVTAQRLVACRRSGPCSCPAPCERRPSKAGSRDTEPQPGAQGRSSSILQQREGSEGASGCCGAAQCPLPTMAGGPAAAARDTRAAQPRGGAGAAMPSGGCAMPGRSCAGLVLPGNGEWRVSCLRAAGWVGACDSRHAEFGWKWGFSGKAHKQPLKFLLLISFWSPGPFSKRPARREGGCRTRFALTPGFSGL